MEPFLPPNANDRPTPQSSDRAAERLVGWSGEFRERDLERAFGAGQFAGFLLHGRWLLMASAILNALFLVSDWRFAGTSHFWPAVLSRGAIILASIGCLRRLSALRTTVDVQRLLGVWVAITGVCVSVLVSSHSELALFVLLLLPMIVYLGVPLPFRWVAWSGVSVSALLLTGFEMGQPSDESLVGLIVALATLNVCLMLVVARANRLRRLEWHATRASRAVADELFASRDMLAKLFDAAPVPMVVTYADDGRILQVNDSCSAMFGIKPEMIGVSSFHQYYARPGDRERLTGELARTGRVDHFETQARCADGKLRAVMVKASLIDLTGGKALVAGIIDISEHKAVEMGLEWLASTDPLTKLPNRLSFFSTARAEMMRSARLARPLSLLMIDLDHFKAINDSFGHLAGDHALKAFGALCIEQLRGTDIIGRLGGEEFGILLPDTDVRSARAISEELCAALRELRLPAPNETLRLTASIGLTNVRHTDNDLDVALARADRALYVAKRNGRDQVQADPADAAQPLLKAVP